MIHFLSETKNMFLQENIKSKSIKFYIWYFRPHTKTSYSNFLMMNIDSEKQIQSLKFDWKKISWNAGQLKSLHV